MATKVYTGVSDVAARVRKIYIGVNGVAQKVRKGYIGIAGVARQFFASSGKVVFKQTKLLSSARYDLNAATVGNYAVFGPGRTSNGFGGNYDAYDSSLALMSISTAGETVAAGYAAATVGDYAIFAGGVSTVNSAEGPVSKCTAINNYLTKTAMADGLGYAKQDLGATTIGSYAIFAGGWMGGNPTNQVEAFNASLTKTIVANLVEARAGLAGTTTRDYAVFADGYNKTSYTNRFDRYSASLTHSTGYLNGITGMASYAAASVGKYALFVGETGYSINNSGTVSTITSSTRTNLAATSLGDYAVFAGGTASAVSGNVSSTIYTYDTSLTRESKLSLPVGRHKLAATTLGDYAMFGGGDTLNNISSTSPSNAVDIYELTE